ncbi:MAG: hypothetical protein HY706_07290 [Candidatus Hydrogenedentes bacterium]|nr:hypothetical protein [Candidatus Hydrogenedentota bacterium]
MIYEGVYCSLWNATRCYLAESNWPRFSERPLVAARAFIWYDPAGYTAPELSCCMFKEILAEHDPATVAYIKNPKKVVIGQLSQPIGERPLYFLHAETASDAQTLERFVRERNIRCVIWDDLIPTPSALTELAGRSDRVLGYFQFYEMKTWTDNKGLVE